MDGVTNEDSGSKICPVVSHVKAPVTRVGPAVMSVMIRFTTIRSWMTREELIG